VTLLDVIDVDALLGESPLWDGRVGLLYWIDIHGERLGVLEAASGDWTTWPTDGRFGSIALTSTPGRLLAATAAGIVMVTVAADGLRALTPIADPERSIPGNRFNDGKTDRQGRFWAGTMDDEEVGRTGAMYRVEPPGVIAAMWKGVGIPNGIAFSPTGDRMYTADSMDRMIWVANYDGRDGVPAPRRLFARIQHPGAPDGSTVDADGHLWNAEWGAGRVTRYAPDGTVAGVLEVPVSQPTCVAFGGSELDLLFVTSAQVGGDGGAHGGSILIYRLDMPGVPETPFPLVGREAGSA